MIASLMHPGSGLGNQLFRYIAVRVLAKDKGFDYGAVTPENFKGYSFMDLNIGKKIEVLCNIEAQTGKVVVSNAHFSKNEGGYTSDLLKTYSKDIGKYVPQGFNMWEEKTNYYNPEINFVKDNTIIDGEFQSIEYFGHRLDEVDEWLRVEPMDMDYETCVIGFRGGEFALFPELFLPKSYWDEAIQMMIDKGVKKFEIHTDDAPLAKEFFKEYPVIHDIGINWRSMRYAKYAIIANSSFYILPRLLSGGITVAPRFWARRNIGEWSRPDHFYRDFLYI